MIEPTNPQIDVNELMQRVRQEAATIASRDGRERRARPERRVLLPQPADAAPPPLLSLSRPIDPTKDRTLERLSKARGMIEVSSKIPKLFRRFFRRQSGYNRAVLETLGSLAKTNEQLAKRVRELTIVAEQQNQWLRQAYPSSIARISDQLRNLQDRQAQDLERHGEHLRNLQGELDHLREEVNRPDPHGEHLRELHAQADRAGVHLRNLQGDADRLAQQLEGVDKRHLNDAIYIKGELSRQAAWLRELIASRSAVSGAVSSSPPNVSAVDAHWLDAFYLSFENRFRGERSEIKRRVRFYLPFIEEARVGTAERPIVDVGCGRGEWLELLREAGLQASGVDLNSAMVEQCRGRELPAIEADAIAHLRSLPDESLGAVTGFHLIEHLPLETLIDLLAETRRVLCADGIAIFESPNCKNLMVGACNFNVDPTHRNPVFPDTAAFMMETQGFDRVQLEYLSPVDTSDLPESNDVPAALQQLLYGPQDFAVIARKPAAA